MISREAWSHVQHARNCVAKLKAEGAPARKHYLKAKAQLARLEKRARDLDRGVKVFKPRPATQTWGLARAIVGHWTSFLTSQGRWS